MNKTNFAHAFYALCMQFPFILINHPWVGAAFAVGWFISREHAHRQVDIAKETGIVVTQQNPMQGFRGWSLDAKLDALFPSVAVIVIAVLF